MSHELKFYEKIREETMQDSKYKYSWKKNKILNSHEQQFKYEVNPKDLLIYRGIIYVPNKKNLKNLTFDEYHKISYADLPRYQELITTLRKWFFWLCMKKEVVEYLAHCLEC